MLNLIVFGQKLMNNCLEKEIRSGQNIKAITGILIKRYDQNSVLSLIKKPNAHLT